MRATFYGMTEKAMHKLDAFCKKSQVNLQIDKNKDFDPTFNCVIQSENKDFSIGSSFRYDIVTLTAFLPDDLPSLTIDVADFERLIIL